MVETKSVKVFKVSSECKTELWKNVKRVFEYQMDVAWITEVTQVKKKLLHFLAR